MKTQKNGRKPEVMSTPEGLPERLIVGISGASGVIYGIRLLETLKSLRVETHLVITKAAEMTLAYETELKTAQVRALAERNYAIGDVGAAIASGSFATLGMVVAPCSIRSMSEIANGPMRRCTAASMRSLLLPRPVRNVPTRSSNSPYALSSTPHKYVIYGRTSCSPSSHPC